VSVFDYVGPAAVAKDLLCYLNAGNLIEMGGSRMSEQPGMQFFIDTELIDHCPENVL